MANGTRGVLSHFYRGPDGVDWFKCCDTDWWRYWWCQMTITPTIFYHWGGWVSKKRAFSFLCPSPYVKLKFGLNWHFLQPSSLDEGLVVCNSVMSGSLSWQKSWCFFVPDVWLLGLSLSGLPPVQTSLGPGSGWPRRGHKLQLHPASPPPESDTPALHTSLTVILGTLVGQINCLTVPGPLFL